MRREFCNVAFALAVEIELLHENGDVGRTALIDNALDPLDPARTTFRAGLAADGNPVERRYAAHATVQVNRAKKRLG